VVRAPLTFDDLIEPSAGQLQLPFPGLVPVVPAPVTRGENTASPLRERAGHLIQALVETLSGERPVRQMSTWMAPSVYDQLVRRLSASTKATGRMPAGRRARVVSVHVVMLDADTAELAARFVHRGRSRAIAVRLESRRNHRGVAMWQCTALTWA
jgi:hypothetical protein